MPNLTWTIVVHLIKTQKSRPHGATQLIPRFDTIIAVKFQNAPIYSLSLNRLQRLRFNQVSFNYRFDKLSRGLVCFNGKVGDYHKQSGVRLSVTKSGRTCQRWDSDSPHNTRNNGPHLASNRNNNYCSDHDLATAWCYTTDPNKRWEECDITLVLLVF